MSKYGTVRFCLNKCLVLLCSNCHVFSSRGESQKSVCDISPTLQESQDKNVTIVWSDFVYWFQLFIIQMCTPMDNSTFASRKSSFELSFDVYISISPKMSLTPFWFSPLICVCQETSMSKLSYFYSFFWFEILKYSVSSPALKHRPFSIRGCSDQQCTSSINHIVLYSHLLAI